MVEADTDQFIGKSLEAMQCYVSEHDLSLRIMANNGEHFYGTCDLRTDRINVELMDDVVTRAWMG